MIIFVLICLLNTAMNNKEVPYDFDMKLNYFILLKEVGELVGD